MPHPDSYCGREFEHGQQDCYSLVRDFYRSEYGLELNDYARPDNWWNSGLNLYMDNFSKEGFQLLDVLPREWERGDLFLMAIGSAVACHAAIYLGDGKILHHFVGRRSNIEPYRGLWRNQTVAVIRHPEVAAKQIRQPTRMDLCDDPRSVKALALLSTRRG